MLTEEETTVLDKGLKYVPSKKLDKFHTFIDIHKYIRKLNVQRYILANPVANHNVLINPGPIHSGLCNPSLFNPPVPASLSINIFKDLVLGDLDALTINKPHNNPSVKAGLKQLCERKELVVRPADKGGAIVILDKCDYENEILNILNDRKTYSPIPCDPTNRFKKDLGIIVKQGFLDLIPNKKEYAFLVPLAPHIPTIYYLPKIHKHATKPPGRPIISGIDSVTSRIGRYIDFFLQPLVKQVPSYWKDTKDTIQLLSNIEFPEGCLLGTANVASLYTCISHQLGFEAVQYYLLQDALLPPSQKLFIMELLSFARSHNYFWFNGQFYLQEKGVAMGAKFAM